MKKKNPRESNRRLDRVKGSTRLWLLPLLALLLTMFVESFSRASVGKMFAYMVQSPLYFGYNFLIILTTLTFSELFRHRQSALCLLCVVWIGLGIAQRMVTIQRTQPFTSMDILMVKDAITLTTIYYTWPEIIAMYGGIFLAAVVVIWVLTRLPKRKHVNYTLALSIFCGLLTLCFCMGSLFVHFGMIPRYYDNLVDAYNQYGFATCFSFTFGDMGVAKPDEYSDETVSDILEEIDEEEEQYAFDESDNLREPNVIYVQLESLIDVNTIIGSEYTTDPTPNFNRLSRDFPSGELYVPSIGGGTANTEFEMLTGMNIDFFGAGEYPYTTILQETTCETIAYTLRSMGYATTAMHNHTATFYSRNEVYARLGFEHFVSLEYMPYVTYTDIGWAEDMVLADEIMKALNASESRDFIMAISVESHGKYEDEYVYTEGDAEIVEMPEQINRGRFSNYMHLIHETDKFVGELVKRLQSYPEPVVVVFYGDHLPSLDLTADILTTGNLYASRYIIWNNYGAQFEAPDLQAYRVSANLLKQLGISGGCISRIHQSEPVDAVDDEEYMTALESLEYDLLYGDCLAYEGENPYEPVDMMMGTLSVTIIDVSNEYGRVLVTGENFTESSVILIDGEAYPTAFVSSEEIVAIVPRTQEVQEVVVAQQTSDGTELSRTAAVSLAK